MLHFIRRHSRPFALRVFVVVVILLLAGLLLASTAGAQEAPRSAAVLLMSGADRNPLFLRDPSGHPAGYASLPDTTLTGIRAVRPRRSRGY